MAFNFFGSRNNFTAGSQIAPPPGGPLSIVGGIGANGQTVNQPGTGITIKTPFNADSNPPVLAARGEPDEPPPPQPQRGAQGPRPRKTASPAPASTRRLTTSPSPSHPPGRPALKAVGDRIAESVKKFKDAASRGTGGPADGTPKQAKASTASEK